MIHVLLALTLAWGFLASGSTVPSAEDPPLQAAAPGLAGRSSPSTRIVVTEHTVILLDGRRCRYEQVPRGAVITFAEVGSDGGNGSARPLP
jgi:hypothetical protein